MVRDADDPGQPHDDRADGRALASRLTAVGSDLAATLREVLQGLPESVQRPNQLAQLLGLNRDISGRVLTAARAPDPLTVTHVAPGPEPLRKFLRAARRRQVAPDLIERAEQAVGRFETLIREEAGDRPSLDAIISSLLPPAREKFELAAKQTIFKGTSLLKGASADLWLHAALVHPAAGDGDHHDVAHVYGTLGLRRVRPGIDVKFTYRQFGTPDRPWTTLDGRPGEAADGTELDRFCRLRPARLEVTRTRSAAVYVARGEAVGPQSTVDKLLAERRPRAMARWAAAPPRNLKSLFVAPAVPVKMLVFDVLLAEDAYPGAEPVLHVYDTAVEGMASVNDPARDADRLDVREQVTVLGRGASAFELSELPRYGEMLEYVTGVLGWSLAGFRGYRCRIQYPMHGCQACLAFEAPPKNP